MTRKDIIMNMIETVEMEITHFKDCIEKDEVFNAITFLANISKGISTCMIHVFIFDKNKL